MTWTSADFRSYPVRCMQFHMLAAAETSPILIGAWAYESEAKAEATLLRQFRFLVRSNPGVDFAADRLLSSYHFRTRVAYNHQGDALLYLSAKPLLCDLVGLNPELADILAA